MQRASSRLPVLASFGVFMQAALAFIAFNIGARLTAARLRSTGGDVAWLTFFQLLAPMITVLAALVVSRLSLPTAMIVAAVAPATAPATTYAVVKRRNASGPFVDRALAILAINDAATILCFDVISAATVAWLGAPGSGDETWTALRLAAFREALSLLIGAGLGVAYLSLHASVAGGRPGWEHRLRAALYALLLLSVGAAIVFGLSNLLTALALGAVVANGVERSTEAKAPAALGDVEEPLYMIFFVLAGAHLPIDDLGQGTLAIMGVVYVLARLGGKYAAVFLGALALRLDVGTRRYLGLCFASQGGAAMGLILAFASSQSVRDLPPAAATVVETGVTIVLLGVLLSQLFGPAVIAYAIERGASETEGSGIRNDK